MRDWTPDSMSCGRPSPDAEGLRVAAACEGDLFLFRWETRCPTPSKERLTETAWDEVDPTLSPDGSRVAFASREHGSLALFETDLVTEVTRALTSGEDPERGPRYSPDGRQIAFARRATAAAAFSCWPSTSFRFREGFEDGRLDRARLRGAGGTTASGEKTPRLEPEASRKGEGFELLLHTNRLRLSERLASAGPHLDHLFVSLDGASAETTVRLRGVDGLAKSVAMRVARGANPFHLPRIRTRIQGFSRLS